VAKKVPDNLVRTILDQIFQGKLVGGARLPSIEELARRHGISVASVREAIHKLSMMGLVRVRQGEGTFLDRNIPSILDILDARKYVEMATCLLAARNATEAEHAELDALIARMEDDFRRRDFVAYTQKDLAFHLAIGRMSKNVVLSAFLENIQDLLHYLQQRTHMLYGTIEKAYHFHRLIAEAIRQRDSGTAQILVTEHIEAVKRAWETYDRGRRTAARKSGGKTSKATRKQSQPGRRRSTRAAAQPKGGPDGHET
jgi:GntR family transcriptional regulator, transcriptional repressor for pyruvate dehydrogenase complex